jgi:hypothetical protein
MVKLVARVKQQTSFPGNPQSRCGAVARTNLP